LNPGIPVFVWTLFFFLLLSGPAGSIAQNEPSDNQKRIEEVAREERRILDELDEIEQQASLIEDRLLDIEARIKDVSKRLDQTDRGVRRIEQRLRKIKTYLAGRLRAIYRLREAGLIQVLVGAESVSELVYRYRYISTILKRDQEALEEFGQRRAELIGLREQLKADRAQLYRLRLDTSAEKDKLKRARHKKTALLITIHRRKELYMAMSRQRQTALKEVIVRSAPAPETRPRPKPAAPSQATPPPRLPDFKGLKGKLLWPVKGKISSRFGRNTGAFNTVTESHGLKISAMAGSRVRAVSAGKVLYLGWVRGYGNIVIIDHGQRYYTLTGGLIGIRLKADQWVSKDETLGLAPGTGESEEKEIYFEVRHGGQPLDPADWLGSPSAGWSAAGKSGS